MTRTRTTSATPKPPNLQPLPSAGAGCHRARSLPDPCLKLPERRHTVNPRRFAAALADSAPVLVLAVIAGAGSFTHIRDTATQHGQRGPMAWAVAVCIDLTCVMAARERQRDKRHGDTRRVSWPTLVLAGGILLSLAANLAQAQPDTWGRIVAATPPASFLVAVSMLERRAGRTTPGRAVPVRVVPDTAGLAEQQDEQATPVVPV